MFIDFHYHYADKEGYIEDLLRDMDRSGVDKTLLMGGSKNDHSWWEYKQCSFKTNEEAYQAVKKYPDRLIGNVTIDPREEDAIDTLKRFVEDYGFRAVKFFPPAGFNPGDERYYPFYEKVAEYRLPILAHTGITNIKIRDMDHPRAAMDSRFAHPLNFDKISRAFPQIIFVLAHMGYPHYLDAWAIAHANENVYLDIAGSGPWTDAIPLVYNVIGGQQAIPIDFNRVIWGSDNCMPQGEHLSYSKHLLKQIGASSVDREKVFGGNAARILKLNV